MSLMWPELAWFDFGMRILRVVHGRDARATLRPCTEYRCSRISIGFSYPHVSGSASNPRIVYNQVTTHEISLKPGAKILRKTNSSRELFAVPGI